MGLMIKFTVGFMNHKPQLHTKINGLKEWNS
jgi:hypothetical protein